MSDDFENLHELDPNLTSDANQDLDGDGMTNLEEYTAGTDPTDPDSFLQIDAVEAGPPTVISFGAQSNKTYTIEFKDDLDNASWMKLLDIAADSNNHVEMIEDPQSRTRRFYRVVTPRQP